LLLVLVGHQSLEPGIFGSFTRAAMQAEIKKVAIDGRRSFAVQRRIIALDYRVRGSRAGLNSGVKSEAFNLPRSWTSGRPSA
jgi:hypothetical protein